MLVDLLSALFVVGVLAGDFFSVFIDEYIWHSMLWDCMHWDCLGEHFLVVCCAI